jgi:CelD/BcsL family acetyltransferase involved in cellulose biosynthesis
MSAIEIQIYDGLGQLDPAAPLWKLLAAKRGRNLPFCGPGFTIAALKTFHAEHRPRIIIALNDGEPEGLLCLVDRPLRAFGVPVSEAGFPFNPHVILNDLLLPGDPSLAQAAASVLLEAAWASGPASLILDHAECEYGSAGAIAAAAARLNIRTDPPKSSRLLYFCQVSGAYDAYLQTRSGNQRRHVSKLARRAAEADSFEICRHRGAAAVMAAMPDWMEVERQSWQSDDPASAMGARGWEFQRMLLSGLEEAEAGDLWMAYAGGKPAAALRMVGSSRRTCVLTTHFDPMFKELAPGLLVFETMMRAAFDEALEEVDMHGRTQMFERWSTGAREHMTFRLYQPGAFGAALKASGGVVRAMRNLRRKT